MWYKKKMTEMKEKESNIREKEMEAADDLLESI
jgi:hypothetical protein